MTKRIEILCVDDEPDIRMITVLALKLDPEVCVREAATGRDALEQLAGGDWRPDAILLDAMMPGMNGVETLEAIRALPGCEAIPVVFMTARASSKDVDDYRARGAAAVIVKPFDPLLLATQVRGIVRA